MTWVTYEFSVNGPNPWHFLNPEQFFDSDANQWVEVSREIENAKEAC